MRSDKLMEDARAELVREFPELLNDDLTMQKEVFAHFGLTFMKMGLVEHSLVNVITFAHVGVALKSKTIRTQADWESAFDMGYEKAVAMTFGNQVKAVLGVPEFADMAEEFRRLKRIRDYFAHHFMREEAAYFGTDEGCWLLLTRIADVRQTFLSVEEALKPRFEAMRARYQLPSPSEDELSTLLEKLRQEYVEALRVGTAKVGWDDDAL